MPRTGFRCSAGIFVIPQHSCSHDLKVAGWVGSTAASSSFQPQPKAISLSNILSLEESQLKDLISLAQLVEDENHGDLPDLAPTRLAHSREGDHDPRIVILPNQISAKSNSSNISRLDDRNREWECDSLANTV